MSQPTTTSPQRLGRFAWCVLVLALSGCAVAPVRDPAAVQTQLDAAARALEGRRPQAASALLERLPDRDLPPALQIRRLGLLAAAQRLDRRPLDAASTLSRLDPLLTDPAARLMNQVALIATLNELDDLALERQARQGRGVLRGWAELTRLARTAAADPRRFESDYRAWRARNPEHPARPELGRQYPALLTGGYAPDSQLAVILPDQGRFAEAARAIRQGIAAARQSDPSGSPPELRFAAGEQPRRIPGIHARAVSQGADRVIGPLPKPAVEALAATAPLAVPTLALNETGADGPVRDNLFQFALSPENEATEAAELAVALGHRRALLLYPRDAWGERLAAALRERWDQLGGTLAGDAGFDPAPAAQDALVDRLAEDAATDVIFLIATANQARALYPRLRLVARPAVPVIATSHVHAGDFDPERDRALVGIHFVDIPWMLGTGAAARLAPRPAAGAADRRAASLARLYAMGIDAYRLAPHLQTLASLPGAYWPGQTGGFWMDGKGRLQRQLTLVQLTASGPRPVALPPRPLRQTGTAGAGIGP